ncbi:MAG: hypothetical protein PHW04_11160 [Candidatus Wallbacteria bacterium]|nr:hypothetical protein [Candidatus Wallbacteria bacterium]
MQCPRCKSVDWKINETRMECWHCKYMIKFDIVTVTEPRYKVIQ